MSELLAVETCTLFFRNWSYSGTFTILPTSVKYEKVKCAGNEQYISIAFSISAFSGGIIGNGTGTGVITGTATKVKCKNGLFNPVREEDEVEIVITDQNSPFGTLNVTVYVLTAGQLKVKAE